LLLKQSKLILLVRASFLRKLRGGSGGAAIEGRTTGLASCTYVLDILRMPSV